MSRFVSLLAIAATCTMLVPTARADDAPATTPEAVSAAEHGLTADHGPIDEHDPVVPADPTPTVGRGFSWGGHAVIPMLLGDVRYAGSPTAAPYYSPGAGVLGRVGIELPYGLALYGIFSLQAFAVEAQKALMLYRGALELRWTIDTGTAALPILSAGGSTLFYVRDGAMGATGGVHASAGVAFAVAWWAQVEIVVELDVAFPGEAFADTVLALVPSAGGTFFF